MTTTMHEQIPDDGLKWFGEGFDGFPRRLPDDCVEYIIHCVDEKLETFAAARNRLNAILKVANDLRKRLLKDYIWQRDEFQLDLHPRIDLSKPTAIKNPPHLRGQTNFGDSVADEWLIVYLLTEISKQFADAWIRLYDTDGEILLIEAANSLPKWLNPEIAENRVWINDGHLKIIPYEDDTSRNLSLQDALSVIRNAPGKLLIEPSIEKEAFYRVREYPSAISSSLHHALITIPRKLAYVLHRNPACISPAIECFYLRDPVNLKPLASKDLSTLYFSPEDFCTVSVRFTKVGYAQLRSQLFSPPPAWTGIIPRMQDEKVAMGMKLTCGFEILVTDPQYQDKRLVREIKLLLEDAESGEEQLPNDAEIDSWPKAQDDEKWLDIDYNDFEKELSGKAGTSKDGMGEGFGDEGAQQHLRKMVSRFQDFLNDDDAGVEGVDDMDEDDAENEDEDEDEDAHGQERNEQAEKDDEVDFERAMNETRNLSASQIKESGLLAEARKLALQDDEEGSDVDEDEEMRKVMELMEKELRGQGALDLNGKGERKGKGKAPVIAQQKSDKPLFGPERPPHLSTKKNVRFGDQDESAEEDVGCGEGELSSDDEEFNDVDLGLAKNMLESFKGQAGMAGPAGNLMRALGVSMPRDEEDGDK